MHLFKTVTTAAMISVFALLAHAAPAPVDHVPATAANPVPAAAAAAVDSVAAVAASAVDPAISPKETRSLPGGYGCPFSPAGCTNKCKELNYKSGSCTGFLGFVCACKDL
ncbi:hypothetical protein BGZ82_001823 [Podila clonocystis]|nr:hypothetical protein BGZ82_001823 [Podila clonocystis]